ncbi:MAG: hypothetical protein NTZ17_14705 [Phycisphaerae bacterium]|nr:hypothetical protein [Phycisphaerae bacterium]
MTTAKTKDIRKALTGKGFRIVESHHEMLWFFVQGKKTSIRTRLSHGSEEYNDSLLGQMAKQLKLKRADLDRLIECLLTEKEYVNKLIHDGHVRLVN